jgi:hypothetical protein
LPIEIGFVKKNQFYYNTISHEGIDGQSVYTVMAFFCPKFGNGEYMELEGMIEENIEP